MVKEVVSTDPNVYLACTASHDHFKKNLAIRVESLNWKRFTPAAR
jgi:hypothetical protein